MRADQGGADQGGADRRGTDQRVAEYLALVARVEAGHAAGHDSDSRLRRIAKHAVPIGLRGTARVAVTDALAARERRKVPALLQREPLLLHLGSGTRYKDGWVNVDLAGDPVDLAWNLARPLPMPAACASGVFSEHVLEHLPFEAGLGLLREAHRVLRPGGIVRIVVPDAGKLLRSYVDGGRGFIEETRGGRPTPMTAVNELFYWYRHCWLYDTQTLVLALEAAGFAETTEREFGASDLPGGSPDTPDRRAESLYVEAVKPA
jgi:predicted SAM-dependent methyltransferase